MVLLLPILLAPAFAAERAWCEIPKSLYAWNCSTERTLDGQSSWWHLLHDTNGCAANLIALAQSHHVARVYVYVGAVEWNQPTPSPI
jgi:hypothetical protein